MYLFGVIFMIRIGFCLAFHTTLLNKALLSAKYDIKLLQPVRKIGESKPPFRDHFKFVGGTCARQLSFLDDLDRVPEKFAPEPASMSPIDQWLEKKETVLNNALSVKELASLYSAILLETCKNSEDPLQTAAFQTLARKFAFHLVNALPQNIELPQVMELVTEAHYGVINDLIVPHKGRTQEEEQDQVTLCLHLASLAYYTYVQVHDMHTSTVTELEVANMRDNEFLAPVLLRLASRCPGFEADTAHQRVAEMNTADFEKMINRRMNLELDPKLTLPAPVEDFSGTSVVHDGVPVFHAGKLVRSIDATLRKSVQESELPELEKIVGNAFRLSIAHRVRKRVECLLESDRDRRELSCDERWAVENVLNSAHESVAAVLTTWQIRHNFVGVARPREESEESREDREEEEESEVQYQRDFLQRVELPAAQNISPQDVPKYLECIPPDLRRTVEFDLEQLEEVFHPSPLLAATAVLGAAVRYSAAEDFRALSVYDIGQDDEIVSRDYIYSAVLAEVLASALLAGRFDEHLFYQHMLAFAALEETLGVREPRSNCRSALNTALRLTVLRLRDLIKAAVPFDASSKDLKMSLPEKITSFVSEVRGRLSIVEKGLHMVLRLPEEESAEAREEAFSWVVEDLLTPRLEEQSVSMREMTRDVPWMAALLSIDPQDASDLLEPLAQDKFDGLIGDMLMNADVAVSMPELGASFEKQVMAVAESLLISVEDAEERVKVLAGAATSAYLLEALEQHQESSFANADLMLNKIFYIYEHPLLKRLQSRADRDLKEFGLIMAVTQLGGERDDLMSLIRMLETVRARRAAAKNGSGMPNQQSRQGWGSENDAEHVPEIPGVLEFVQSMQAFLLQQFTSGEFL